VWRSGQVSRLRNGRAKFGERDGLRSRARIAEGRAQESCCRHGPGPRLSSARALEGVRRSGAPETRRASQLVDREELSGGSEARVLYLPAAVTVADPVMPLVFNRRVEMISRGKDGTIWISEVARSAHRFRDSDKAPVTEVDGRRNDVLIDSREACGSVSGQWSTTLFGLAAHLAGGRLPALDIEAGNDREGCLLST